MIRYILFKIGDDEAWHKGIVHAYMNGTAVVEHATTSELHAVTLDPSMLKFEISMADWVKMQMEAQALQKAQSVMAMPPPPPSAFRR